MNSRAVAALVLSQVLYHGKSLTAALPYVISHYPQLRDAHLTQEMCYGVLRHFNGLEAILAKLMQKPVKAKEHEIYYLLLIGLYQLIYLNVPVHAAISETVNAAKDLKKQWATGLVNAVLRNFLRNKDNLLAIMTEANQLLSVQYSHPEWLIAAIKKAWPDDWQTILTANNQHPPMVLRVNLNKVSRENYLLELQQAGISAQPHAIVATAIVLDKPTHVNNLPGFFEGKVSIQDVASQLAATLLALKPGLTVLDACAAPGGKTCHILESEPNLAKVVAVDIDAERLTKIQENLQRLQLKAELKAGDAMDTESWWNGEMFDRILCDAPCSATGVIRRHPDIKYLRQPDDIAELQQQQLSILKALWPTLKPGGRLVYSTCSILPAENKEVIEQFLQTEPNAKSITITEAWGTPSGPGRQLLPDLHQNDGFFYAILEKT